MPISASESVAIILVCALCTFLERYLPFAFFERREVPSVVRY
ncbi:MAG: AzlD domain-containing protein, partial [Oscillospiraceae bacterium]|nr:AzlD domain-containing protein [Oscillospiraceae bacterium]